MSSIFYVVLLTVFVISDRTIQMLAIYIQDSSDKTPVMSLDEKTDI